MRICLVGKYPPIQGGVSARNFWIARWLARRGHEVHVVTNAEEVEAGFRIRWLAGDDEWLEPRFERGSVRVWRTEPHGPRARHIPDHNPFVTKLASLAAMAIEDHAIDVVLGVYLEPYAVAAHLAAQWTNRPFAVRHAGSDVGRLLPQPQLGRCYEEVLRHADLVCGSASTLEQFARLGIAAANLHQDPGFAIPNEIFNPDAPALDVDSVTATLVADAGDAASRPFDRNLPTLGIYGKIGPAKGSYDLVAALGELKRRGREFNFVAMCGGDAAEVARFLEAIERSGLQRETRRLPFLAHWRVPGFLRALSAACFLENRFPIAAHGPGIPQEVLAVGVPLVTTVEIARKQMFAQALVHGRNVLIVRDPRDHAELAGVLDRAIADRAALAALGREGRLCLPPSDVDACTASYEAMLERAIAVHRGHTSKVRRSAAASLDTPAWRYFPAGRRALGPAADEIDLPGIGDDYQATLRLCEACADRWHERADSLPRYTAEVLRFELHRVPDPQKSAEADALLFRGEGGPMPDAAVALAANVTLRRFDYDMDALTRALEADGEPVADWPEEPVCYVFQHLPGRARNRVVRVSEAVYRLLEAVDGRATIGGLLHETGACDQAVGNAPSLGAISALFRDGIIVSATARARGP